MPNHCDGCCRLCARKCITPVCFEGCVQICKHYAKNYITERRYKKDGTILKTIYDFTPLLGVKRIDELTRYKGETR